MTRWRLSAALLVLAVPLSAQAAFITDRIEVPVYTDKYGQGAVVKKLVSGSRVDILMKDGKYARIRSNDGSSGWVEYRYISTEKPLGLEYLELRSRHKAMQDELASTQAKLSEALRTPVAAAPVSGAVSIDEKELAELRQGAKDTHWMRAEMNKARERAKKLDAELKAVRKKASEKTDATAAEQAELEALRAQNKDLQERLAAALLVSAAPVAGMDDATDVEGAKSDAEDGAVETSTTDSTATPAAGNAPPWSVSIEWFLGSLLLALILGGLGGVSWLDRRIREKHGGFRIY